MLEAKLPTDEKLSPAAVEWMQSPEVWDLFGKVDDDGPELLDGGIPMNQGDVSLPSHGNYSVKTRCSIPFIQNHLARGMKPMVFECHKHVFITFSFIVRNHQVFLMFPDLSRCFQVSVCCLHPGDLLLFLGQSCHAGCNGAAQMSLSLFHGAMPLSYMLQGAFGVPYQLMARKLMS